MSWYKPAGTLATQEAEISLTPNDAQWEFCGFYTYNFAKSADVKVELKGREAILLPLSAQDVKVEVGGQSFTLKGRTGVFASVSDWIYLPVNSSVKFSGKSGEVALLTAEASEAFPVCYTPAEAVSYPVRLGPAVAHHGALETSMCARGKRAQQKLRGKTHFWSFSTGF